MSSGSFGLKIKTLSMFAFVDVVSIPYTDIIGHFDLALRIYKNSMTSCYFFCI